MFTSNFGLWKFSVTSIATDIKMVNTFILMRFTTFMFQKVSFRLIGFITKLTNKSFRFYSFKSNYIFSSLNFGLWPRHTNRSQLITKMFIYLQTISKSSIMSLYSLWIEALVTSFSEYWHNVLILEMGLNREPERFLKIKFASDPLHIENHTTCSASFPGLDNLASFPINIEEDFWPISWLRKVISRSEAKFDHTQLFS